MKKRIVQQFDAKDCGVACLTSVCSFYGKEIELHKIRRLASTTSEGNSVFSLLNAAKELGFDADAWQVDDYTELKNQIEFPVIAHVVTEEGYGHFVVIWEMKKDKFLIGDPECGLNRLVPMDQLASACTGIVISLLPGDNFVQEKKVNKKTELFKRILKENKLSVLKIVIISVIVYLISMSGSLYYQRFIDEFIFDDTYTKVYLLGVALIFAYLVQAGLNVFRQKSIIKMSRNIDDHLILGSYQHIIKLPMDFFDTRKKGEVLNRLNDAFKIHEVICSMAISIVLDVIVALFGACVMLSINSSLFLICTVVSVISLLVALVMKNRIKQVKMFMMQKNGEFSSAIIEHLAGEEVIKTYSYEEKSASIIKEKYNQLIEFANKSVAVSTFQNVFTEFMSSSTGIAVLMLGFTFIVKGEMTIGQLIMFNTMLSYFLNPVCNLIGIIPEIQDASVAGERLVELLDMDTEVIKNDDSEPLIIEDISVENMGFKYGDNEVFKNLNLHIERGECIAIVGESGCGKTTLIKAIMGLYPISSGNIYFGKQNLNSLAVNELRRKVAYVPQNTFLFANTIKENLVMGQDISDKEIEDACKAVEMHEKISKMPNGYFTKLEEGGTNLSGGEKQRLAIARAFLKKDAELYVLDEATSNLDSKTENAISKVVFEQLADKTRIIIAHRMSTVVLCDRIIVMNSEGEIVEIGKHDELLSKKGLYYKLWSRQNGCDISEMKEIA